MKAERKILLGMIILLAIASIIFNIITVSKNNSFNQNSFWIGWNSVIFLTGFLALILEKDKNGSGN